MAENLTVTYPPELPITARREELLAAIEANQVLVVAGETGSGKSTQLPKLCLELGRGTDAMIGHTQPRRLAARTIAERIASELEVPLGTTVGYTVRFNDRVSGDTRLRLMTDGILLAELGRDRSLRAYDTIIVDEAHERSLNIDFILGYLKQLLPRRPDLKVIITSATIDTERFSRHFDDAPVIEVSGRTYPVETRYRPLEGPDQAESLDQTDGVLAAVQELWRDTDGDILVFCSGEREIRDATEALTDLKLPGSEILPLFARLSAAEQQRVFRPHGRRRIVVATNVAETSITVPGIRSVIDTGTARISRYSSRTKVQRLPIEPISQASANQRAGRCGRLGPGICVRLYAEDDFDGRPEFTEPEIRRTNLASVILQMASLRLGPIEEFGFVDPPDHRNIKDGIDLLTELDAIDPAVPQPKAETGQRRNRRRRGKPWLTPIGRTLARLPVDPRYGRMLIEAADNGCVNEVMIIVAGLSVQDPRERPRDNEQKAIELHKRFADPESDFWSYLNLWDYLSNARRDRSRNQFRRLCRRELLHHQRIMEWQDIHAQLRQITRELDLRPSRSNDRRRDERVDDRARRDAVHRSILAGLLSHIGLKEDRDRNSRGRGQRRQRVEYVGARNARFAIAPGTALDGRPGWVMAAELVETNRLWARILAGVEPDWIEDLAGHIATYTYTERWWDRDRGSATTTERVTLYGLPLAADRAVPLHTVDPESAKELFIHHALIEGDWEGEHDFLTHNRALLAEVDAMEARARRRDLAVEHKAIHDFYHHRIPDDVVTAAHFETWWRTQRPSEPGRLDLSLGDVLRADAVPIDDALFPEGWIVGDHDLELAYELDPHSPLDGVSVLVPVDLLNQLDPETFAWSVPGFRAELVTELIKTLPKRLRRVFVPLNETAAEVLDRLDPGSGPLLELLAAELGRRAGTPVSVDDFHLDRVPPHLRPTFRVINDRYELLAEGEDLQLLKAELDSEVRATLSIAVADDQRWRREGLRSWDVADLPRVVEVGAVKAYPALVDEGDSVAIRPTASPDEQYESMWNGVRRLLRFQIASPVRRLDDLLDPTTKLDLARGYVQSKAEWYNDAVDAALDSIIAGAGGPVWTEPAFNALVTTVRDRLDDRLAEVATGIDRFVATLRSIHPKLDRLDTESYAVSVDDVRAHLGRLTYPGFLAGVGIERLDDVGRYLEAIDRRLDNLAKNPARDLDLLAQCRRLDSELASLRASRPGSAELEDATWLLEELRVSLFAQTVGAKGKVSPKRVRRALDRLRAPAGGVA